MIYLDRDGLGGMHKIFWESMGQCEDLICQIRKLQLSLYQDPQFCAEAQYSEIMQKLESAQQRMHFIRDAIDDIHSHVNKIMDEGLSIESDLVRKAGDLLIPEEAQNE